MTEPRGLRLPEQRLSQIHHNPVGKQQLEAQIAATLGMPPQEVKDRIRYRVSPLERD